MAVTQDGGTDIDAASVPADSDFHYASFYVPAAARPALRALEACRREIAAIPHEVSDRGVAHLKLAWWHDELERLAQAVPRHPATRALATAGNATGAIVARLERYRGLVEDSLAATAPATRAALLEGQCALHRPILECWFEVLRTRPDAATVEGLCTLGALAELAHALRNLRNQRRAPCLPMARDTLARRGLDADDVREARTSTALGDVVAAELGWIAGELSAGLARLSRAERRRQRLPVTLARLALAALRLTLADGCAVLERRVELLPLAKLGHAWRTRYLG